MLVDAFPILAAAARARGARALTALEDALRALGEGVTTASIRNTVFAEAKQTIGRIADDAWDRHVRAPYFHGSAWQGLDRATQDLGNDISIMSLHDVLSAARKVQRSAAAGPCVAAMRAFVAEVLPLAEQTASLKDKVLKGRAPSTGPAKPENPNKIVRTCACCFRGIATAGAGGMAHHGYERPGHGSQTSSCVGINYPCLEISDAGLVVITDATRRRLALLQQAWAERGAKTHLITYENVRGGGFKTVETRKGELVWAREFESYCWKLESDIRFDQRTLTELEARIAAWEQTEMAPGVPVATAEADEPVGGATESMKP